jgi:hypothetical protein
MSNIKTYGNIITPANIRIDMQDLHRHLMDMGFPYSSVSVIYRPQDLGLCCIFSYSVKDKVDEKVIDLIKSRKANYFINQPHAEG